MDFFCTTFLTQLFHFFFFSCCILKDYSPQNSKKLVFFLQLPMFQGVQLACFQVCHKISLSNFQMPIYSHVFGGVAYWEREYC